MVGSPETVARRLTQQHQLIGDDLFCDNHRFGPMPVEQSLKSLKLFGDEAIPALRS
jgi:alkanesulfonate monooxygenase SsuD/methylene tetrahydromethanopterin reductase-like flavin-dependent oxidoreductase (luciferase family)